MDREHALACDNERLRAVLQRIADRRPSSTGEAAAFYRCREDARSALREPWGGGGSAMARSRFGVDEMAALLDRKGR
jgi:hypothetical protein